MISLFSKQLNDADGNKHQQYLIGRAFSIVTGMLLLMLLSNLAFAHGMSEEEKQAVIQGGNLRYMWLGATHMLSGYDHLAFVFGIIFFLTSFRDIAKYVTAFTVGHSITLIYATFNAIQLNYFLIDAVIGLSVSYIAFCNIDGFRKYLNVNPPNMMLMIIGLGLIHGFGLSTRLQQLPLSEDDLLLNIISFNVGIELGQISALALMLLLIAAWRKGHFFKTFSLITNYALVLMGGLLFLMQMHGYEHTANAEEFVASAEAAQRDDAAGNKASGKAVTDLSQLGWKDTISISIPARGETEYKLFADNGSTFVYAWETDGEMLFYDFHGEPTGDTSGYFKSFQKSTDSKANGSLTASFTGTHGWYWKNNTRYPVVVTLKVKGDYKLKDKVKVEEKTEPVVEQQVHDTID